MKTKQKIINAALKVLGEQGYQALTQTRVAEVAELRQGLLTYHFPTRSDLLKAVVEESKAQMAQSYLDAQAPFTLERLQEMVINLALSKTFPRIMLSLSLAADEDPALSNWFVDADVAARQNFRTALARLHLQVDESELHLLRASIVGASLINLQQNTERSEQVARDVVAAAFQRIQERVRPV